MPILLRRQLLDSLWQLLNRPRPWT